MTRHDLFAEAIPSRFVVGIDLGTTNSAVCYVDTQHDEWRIDGFALPQLVAVGQIEARETLPSFHYQPARAESSDALRLPWQRRPPDYLVGCLARDQGTLTPGRLIASAKSWLCHNGVDRSAHLLPWHGAEDVERLSPIEVSSRYLRHIRNAWDSRFADQPLADQDIVLTLPASFDEVARELTVQAAAAAGLPRVVLIEEPQAAFYAWVNAHRDCWSQIVQPGQQILVCDIGGGTSDFTLIRVRAKQNGDSGDEAIQFHRVAVGEHLILGGDNLDLALARFLEERVGDSGRLEPRQWEVLISRCRQVKELLLSAEPPDRTTIHLPAGGSRLIAGGITIEVTRQDVLTTLLEGFFPLVGINERPMQRRSGFQEFGLPYAPDAAVTRYLASFLRAHGQRQGDFERPASDTAVKTSAGPSGHPPSSAARPDLVLFNGGLFASPWIRQRVTEVIESWFRTPDAPEWSPTILENDLLHLAVARGAAYYGMVRRGTGIRISANLARSYYVEVASDGDERTAVCLVPGSAQPGEVIQLVDRTFELRISEPVEFPLYVSSTRLADEPGQTVLVDSEQMRALPPIRTVLRTQRRNERGMVPVQLHVALSEVGTMELWCTQVGQDRRWRLQFDVRAATETDRVASQTTGEAEGILDDTAWNDCQQVLRDTFEGDGKPRDLMRRLVLATGGDRSQWPMSLLRRIWEALLAYEPSRGRSPQHEARWLNLVGFSLRPGYGMAADDWRVTETWRLVQGRLTHHSPACRNELWILWRRIAGGLPAGQQHAIAEPILASVRALHRRLAGGHVRGEVNFSLPESAELWRLLGSLELLPVRLKSDLVEMLLDLIPKKKVQPVRHALTWAVGRLGARQPVYGPLNTVVDAALAAKWAQVVQNFETDLDVRQLAVMQLTRHTGDRYRDVSDTARQTATNWLAQHTAPQHLIELVRDGGELDAEQQGQVFGESLPHGLRIR